MDLLKELVRFGLNFDFIIRRDHRKYSPRVNESVDGIVAHLRLYLENQRKTEFWHYRVNSLYILYE